MPKSMSARAEFTFNLIDRGILNIQDTGDRYKIMKMLEVGYTDMLYDDYSLYVNQAQNENKMFEEGKPSRVRDFQDHEVHIREHNRFRNGTKYEQLPQVMQEYLDSHVLEHLQFQANLTQEEKMALDTLPNEQKYSALMQTLASRNQMQVQNQPN
jgi:hypothetical protein